MKATGKDPRNRFECKNNNAPKYQELCQYLGVEQKGTIPFVEHSSMIEFTGDLWHMVAGLRSSSIRRITETFVLTANVIRRHTHIHVRLLVISYLFLNPHFRFNANFLLLTQK